MKNSLRWLREENILVAEAKEEVADRGNSEQKRVREEVAHIRGCSETK